MHIDSSGEWRYCSLLNKIFYLQLLFIQEEIKIPKFSVKNDCLREENAGSFLSEP